MADSVAAERDVTDDVDKMTSPSRRAVDFSISGLLSSHVDRNSALHTDRQLHLNSSAVDDSAALLRHRLAAAALWYPWLHSVASLQSASSRHHVTRGTMSLYLNTSL